MIMITVIAGCEDVFEFSPYAANVKDAYKGIGGKNLTKIEGKNNNQSKFKFAIFTDPHFNYHELDEAVINVNARNDIDFVIVSGDFADHGYLKEYELFHERMKKLDVPYLTVIGNHDYRSNGEDIYKEMFGKYNYSFEYGNSKFILWDNVFWESNKKPNFNWLEYELDDSEENENIFVICHIPPYGDQFDNESEERYSELMEESNVSLSIHGHVHRNYFGEYYQDGVDYLSVEAIMDNEYVTVSVQDDEIDVKIIRY